MKAFFLLAALAGGPAAAQEVPEGGQAASSFGPRAVFLKPGSAQRGRWAPGAQGRLHLAPGYALEGSLDRALFRAAGEDVTSWVLQGTVVGWFFPDAELSPYLLLGAGWYVTDSKGGYSDPYRRFGPHAGAGLSWARGPWSLDGSWRYLWTQDHTLTRTWGRDFRRRGHMYTAALLRRL